MIVKGKGTCPSWGDTGQTGQGGTFQNRLSKQREGAREVHLRGTCERWTSPGE